MSDYAITKCLSDQKESKLCLNELMLVAVTRDTGKLFQDWMTRLLKKLLLTFNRQRVVHNFNELASCSLIM